MQSFCSIIFSLIVYIFVLDILLRGKNSEVKVHITDYLSLDDLREYIVKFSAFISV